MSALFEKAMIIDDNPIDLYIAKRLLEKTDFAKDILFYSSAIDALDYLEQHKLEMELLPNVILVDIYMPEMSGFEFLDAYRLLSDKLKQHCKVYIVSSSIDSKDIKRADEDPNVIAFQEKPLTREFLSTIPTA